jgi:cysteine desulfurase
MQIYLDHGATTPTRPEAISLMHEVMTSQWGNPSSLHAWGERSTMAIERARLMVANLINGEAENIIFTSGGTEADNLALFGVARQYAQPQHMVISSVEHSAIARSAEWLEQMGWQITRLPVDRAGKIDPQSLIAALQPNTVLVSIIYGQNEVGTIQPIDKLGQICRDAAVWFHTDAVQAVGHIPIDVQTLPIDLLSISSHKIYGPQGVGALYMRPEVRLQPLLCGGGQEGGLRSGTQPVTAIAGFGLAAQLAQQELARESARLSQLRDRLFAQLSDIPDLTPTGAIQAERLPHHVSFCHCRINGRRLVRAMNATGIAISSGSACSSGSLVPSATLLAMGYSHEQALGAIRLTLGKSTTEADIDRTAQMLRQAIEHEELSGLKQALPL